MGCYRNCVFLCVAVESVGFVLLVWVLRVCVVGMGTVGLCVAIGRNSGFVCCYRNCGFLCVAIETVGFVCCYRNCGLCVVVGSTLRTLAVVTPS